jgi:hypothetical protein
MLFVISKSFLGPRIRPGGAAAKTARYFCTDPKPLAKNADLLCDSDGKALSRANLILCYCKCYGTLVCLGQTSKALKPAIFSSVQALGTRGIASPAV